MTMTWFKVHHEIVDDIKIRRFTSQEKWAWIALLCLASKSSERGTIDADEDDIADYCEFNSTQDWLYYRDKLIVKGMIEIGASGKLLIVNWHKRQDRKPSDQPEQVKKRVAASRAKKKAESQSQPKPDLTVTPCNAIQVECNADVSPQTRLDQTRLDQTRGEETRSDQIREENTRSEDIYTPPVENFSEPCQPTKEILIAGMAEEIKENPPPTPALFSTENVGLAIAETEKPKKNKNTLDRDRLEFQPFLDVWLQDKVEDWVPHRSLSPTAISKLKTLCKHYVNALEIFQKALWYAQSDSYHKRVPKKWTIEEFLSTSKPYQYYEKYEQAPKKESAHGDSLMSNDEIKQARIFAQIQQAMGVAS